MHCMWIPSKLHTELRQPTVKLQSNFQCEHRSLFGQALDRLVTVSSTRYRASTSALSTLYSSRDLTHLCEGYLILRGASRLDAFSVYPFRTWLLCHAVGRQQIHQWSVHPGPLVLRTAPLKYPPPAPDNFALEFNGDVYACDHWVEPDWLIGNVADE